MPISAANKKLYPPNWRDISDRIRFKRAGGQCECGGLCGLSHGGERCQERHGLEAITFNGKVVLTVAHLDHNPSHVSDINLVALCQDCHLRYDRKLHQRNAAETRHKKKAPAQRNLFE